MENECEALPGVAYPGVNQSINQKVNLYSASSIKKFSDAPPTHKHGVWTTAAP